MDKIATGASSLRDNSPLSDRPEWLSPRDLQEVFGIGRTKSFNICKAPPDMYGRGSSRVSRKTVMKERMDKGKLPRVAHLLMLVMLPKLHPHRQPVT